jgi:hypothetical protein
MEYLTVSKSFFLLTVKYSEVKKMWDDNRANGMTTGFYLVVMAEVVEAVMVEVVEVVMAKEGVGAKSQ